MEQLLEILEDIQPDAELEDAFGVSVTPAEIVPENFNSAKALWAMVCRLKEEA